MTINRLSLYNNALLMAGERALASLTEAREPRRLLDQVWDTGGVKKCLEQGQWKFAMRTAEVDYDPNVSPPFGNARAFSKPSDWVLTSAVCLDAYFRQPLLNYTDESGYWYADVDTIYVRYVSDDNAYGMNLGLWPGSFEDFVAAFFAERVVFKLSTSEEALSKAAKRVERLKKLALSRDAMADPSKVLPPGRWNRARLSNSARNDLGYRTGDLY